MSQLFSTELLPASVRLDAWQWYAKQICGDCRFQLPNASFHGSIEVRQAGGLRLTRFSSSPLSFWKWPTSTARAEDRSCIVITQIAGVRRYVQRGVSVLLRPGDSTLIDAGHPWSSTCDTDCARLYLRVPRWMIEDELRMRGIPTVQRLCGDVEPGATLSRLAHALYEEAGRMTEGESAAALRAYFAGLAVCIGGRPATQPGTELRRRIHGFIDAHISEPALGPAMIASAMGISVRHLHRLFSAGGGTLGDCIRERRLQQCRTDLANPQLREKTITEIAFFWGFSDSAHFSHSFRKQFGVCPRSFREQAASRGWRRLNAERPSEFLGPNLRESHYSNPN